MEEQKSFLFYMDTSSNLLKLGQGELQIKEQIKENFSKNIDNMIKNYKDLPSILVYIGIYMDSLVEARQLYVEGKFYSCIIMCGVTAEIIAKDILKKNIYIGDEKKNVLIEEELSKVFDRIDTETIRLILLKSRLIEADLAKKFQRLLQLRNEHAHSVKQTQIEDALKSVKYLHEIIESTVSIFVDYRIENGKLVKK